MPIIKVPGGYKYGETGKVFKTRGEAEKQMRAIKVAQANRDSKTNNKKNK